MKLHGQKKRLAFTVAVVATSALGLTAAGRRASAAPAVSDPDISVEADISERKLLIKQGGEVVETYAVAVGKDSKPTPLGNYKIRKIIWNPEWIPPDEPWAKGKKPQPPGAKANPMKLVKIFFKEPDYYIHGTADIASLGSADSHGCLRMSPEDVTELGKWVLEHGGQPRDENWFWRILHFRSETKTVYLDNPITLTISN